MTPRRLTQLLFACALLAVAVAGCGTKGENKDPVREGIATDIAGLDYNVYLTRQLNPKSVEDRAYYPGDENAPECLAKPGSTQPTLTPQERPQKCPTNLYGVFMNVCNETTNSVVQSAREPTVSKGRTFPGDFEIEDSQGNRYQPLVLPADNPFAYKSAPLKKGACMPAAGSAAATSPTGGALLVFRIPVASTENRPLELSISSGGQTKHFELDI